MVLCLVYLRHVDNSTSLYIARGNKLKGLIKRVIVPVKRNVKKKKVAVNDYLKRQNILVNVLNTSNTFRLTNNMFFWLGNLHLLRWKKKEMHFPPVEGNSNADA